MSLIGFEETVRTIDAPREVRPTLGGGLGTVLLSSPHPFESIVVPLDGSHFAEHAIPLALALARRSGGVLKLVRVFTPGETATLYPGGDAFDVIEGQLRKDARNDLERMQHRIALAAPEVTVMTHLVEAASVSDGLMRISRTADLVVMATHGRGWFARFFLGSNGRELLRGRSRPTIFVRGRNAPVDVSGDAVPRNLVVALDGRRLSEGALDVAGAVARLTGARSTLLHVDNPEEDDERFAHSSPEGYLRWTRREFAKRAPDVSTCIVREAADPTRGLLSHADESGADLIVVTSRPEANSVRRTAESLIRKSPVPVLVVGE